MSSMPALYGSPLSFSVACVSGGPPGPAAAMAPPLRGGGGGGISGTASRPRPARSEARRGDPAVLPLFLFACTGTRPPWDSISVQPRVKR